MKVTVEQIAPERAEEVLLRCHDPKEPWVEEIQSIAAGQITVNGMADGKLCRLFNPTSELPVVTFFGRCILLTLVSMLTLLIYASGEELSNRAWWIRTLLHAILLEAVLLPLAHNWGFWYNTLDGLIYGTFILAAKTIWHLIDFGQSFYMAAALNEQIRKRKREEIQKEGTNNG